MKVKVFALALLLSGALNAQDSLFTLKQAVDIALHQNLEIQIASSDLEIAKINNNWGNAGGLPTITGNISNTDAVSNIDQKLANGSNIQRNNVSNSNFNANVGISWRVFNGQRVKATKERFESLEKMGAIALNQQIDQIVFDVISTYYNLIRLNKQTLATKAMIALSEDRLKIAQTRLDVGSAAKTDMLQASIDLNAQLVNLKEITNQISDTKALINTILKRAVNEPFIASEDQFQIPDLNYQAIVEKIEKQNPQLLVAQQEKLNLLTERKIINSQRIPSLTLNSNTTLNRSRSKAGFFLTNQTFGPNIGVGVGIPIFAGNVTKTELKVNSVQQKRQDLQIDQIRTAILRDLYIAYQDYEYSLSLINVEEKNIKLAEENNMIATERFKKLQTNSIELRQAQLSLIEAQDRLIQAQYRAQLSAMTLKFLSGEITRF
ncbi:MAG: TolC family protein [bacterium]